MSAPSRSGMNEAYGCRRSRAGASNRRALPNLWLTGGTSVRPHPPGRTGGAARTCRSCAVHANVARVLPSSLPERLVGQTRSRPTSAIAVVARPRRSRFSGYKAQTSSRAGEGRSPSTLPQLTGRPDGHGFPSRGGVPSMQSVRSCTRAQRDVRRRQSWSPLHLSCRPRHQYATRAPSVAPGGVQQTPRRTDKLFTAWQARYTAPDGRERTKRFDRKVDAEKWLDTNDADIARGQWIDPRAEKETLQI